MLSVLAGHVRDHGRMDARTRACAIDLGGFAREIRLHALAPRVGKIRPWEETGASAALLVATNEKISCFLCGHILGQVLRQRERFALGVKKINKQGADRGFGQGTVGQH